MKKVILTVTVTALTLTGVGCQKSPEQMQLTSPEQSSANMWLVDSLQQQQIANAIIRQHTLYPHHFLPGAAILNDLGRRDLAVLTEHFENYPGRLNVRRGSDGQDLYTKRIETIRRAMAHAGVRPDRIQVIDELAGGDGLLSEHVLVVLSEKNPVWQPYKR